MRKFLISLMAASMLVPVAANAADRDSRRADRQAERSERRSENRAQRVERQAQQRVDRQQRQETRNMRAERQPRAERRIERNQPVRQVERVQRVDRDRRVERNQPVRQVQPVQQVQHVDRTRQGVRNDNLLSGIKEAARRGGDRDWRDDRHDRDWSRDWRRDRRYDWYNYRHRYGSLFRLGRYYDPYGWGYRRFSIGFSLWPSYYGSSFWLNDPWQYRLPPAYGPYRWVRYYDDALLVNIYTGQVVDVVYNVFW